jgi:DNA repair protein RadC
MSINNEKEQEVLAHLLGFTRAKAKQKTADKLLSEFGSLKQVFDADVAELSYIVSKQGAYLINFIRECVPLYLSLQIKESPSASSPQEVINYLKARLSGEAVEKLYLILLNAGNKIIEIVEVESGTVNKSAVIPRKIASIALKLNAASAILAHNHPAGSLRPSNNDIDATKAVKNALRSLDISLLDNIIIAHNDYFSFREHSLI